LNLNRKYKLVNKNRNLKRVKERKKGLPCQAKPHQSSPGPAHHRHHVDQAQLSPTQDTVPLRSKNISERREFILILFLSGARQHDALLAAVDLSLSGRVTRLVLEAYKYPETNPSSQFLIFSSNFFSGRNPSSPAISSRR
jgi:hypothetical protein